MAHSGASENDEKATKKAQKSINELKMYALMLKFYEFLHLIRVIFYLRFKGSAYLCMPHASENKDFRSKSHSHGEFDGSSF